MTIEQAKEEALTIAQAAALLGVGERFIRNAIILWNKTKGTDNPQGLPAFFPGGKSAGNPVKGGGPGMGWRVWRSDLQKWYFGGPAPR